MERALTPDERIRRAEENYYRKRTQTERKETARVNVAEKRNYYLLQRMGFQIAICVLLYCILYLIQTTDYVFSGDVIGKTREILSHDIDFQEIYITASEYINGFIYTDENGEEETKHKEEEKKQENLKENNVESTEEATGGAEVDVSDEEQYLTQMEIDAKDIRENYSIILPLQGTVTSRFGNRNPTTATVPKYHTGIDLSSDTGTVFIAAMAGTVELVSDVGDYRKTCKNSKWRCNDFICAL